MSEHAERPGMLRIAAAVILGLISGTILFLIVALGIGVINDKLGMRIPVNLLIAENIFSAILLVLLIIVCIAGFCWQVWITPSSETGTEDFGPEE
ncbi:MAG: hypothetical protein Q7T80_02295 [Methanoregula sp.]|nr:hypothetical protein [Methanoregula sp.]